MQQRDTGASQGNLRFRVEYSEKSLNTVQNCEGRFDFFSSFPPSPLFVPLVRTEMEATC